MEAFSHMNGTHELPTINLACHLDRIPAELRERRQWLNWRPEWRAEKRGYTKIPTAPETGRAMSPTNPDLWRSFEDVIATAGEQYGVGYSFSAEDPFVGLDIDGCIDEAGTIHPAVQDLMTKYPTYWEKSPSGAGVHGFFLDLLPSGLGCNMILL
jgi:putative DNA primase/helicase